MQNKKSFGLEDVYKAIAGHPSYVLNTFTLGECHVWVAGCHLALGDAVFVFHDIPCCSIGNKLVHCFPPWGLLCVFI